MKGLSKINNNKEPGLLTLLLVYLPHSVCNFYRGHYDKDSWFLQSISNTCQKRGYVVIFMGLIFPIIKDFDTSPYIIPVFYVMIIGTYGRYLGNLQHILINSHI